jgi:hypothetical protein
MSITNQSFLESWIKFNCHYYSFMANTLFEAYPEREENPSRFIAIEMYKIQNEIIETLGMWFDALKKTAFKPEMKIHVYYNKSRISPVEFKKFYEEIITKNEIQFLKMLGISENLRPYKLDESGYWQLIKDMKVNLERVFDFKFTDNNTMTHMYYRESLKIQFNT